jgi:hypothetical protein
MPLSPKRRVAAARGELGACDDERESAMGEPALKSEGLGAPYSSNDTRAAGEHSALTFTYRLLARSPSYLARHEIMIRNTAA